MIKDIKKKEDTSENLPTYFPPGVPEISGKLQGFPTHLGIPNTELAPPDHSPYQHLNLGGPFGKYPV